MGVVGTGTSHPPFNVWLFNTLQERQNDMTGNIYCNGDISFICANRQTQTLGGYTNYCLYVPPTMSASPMTTYTGNMVWDYPNNIRTLEVTFSQTSISNDFVSEVSEPFLDGDNRYTIYVDIYCDSYPTYGTYELYLTYKSQQTYSSGYALDPLDYMIRDICGVYWIDPYTGERQQLSTPNNYDFMALPYGINFMMTTNFYNSWIAYSDVLGYRYNWSDLAIYSNGYWNPSGNVG